VETGNDNADERMVFREGCGGELLERLRARRPARGALHTQEVPQRAGDKIIASFSTQAERTTQAIDVDEGRAIEQRAPSRPKRLRRASSARLPFLWERRPFAQFPIPPLAPRRSQPDTIAATDETSAARAPKWRR